MYGQWSGHCVYLGEDTATMSEYTTQRIDELLRDIDRLRRSLDGNDARHMPEHQNEVCHSYYLLAIAKAKLQSLKTLREGNGNETV
jgi:hypothetical protein